MPTDIVERLETQVVAMQFSLCSKQKQMQDYFKSSPRAPTPSKEPRAPTPIKDVSFKTVADATKDVSLVDSLDMDDIELESIDTTIASVAASALMKETPTWFSTPKHSCPLQVCLQHLQHLYHNPLQVHLQLLHPNPLPRK